VYAGDLRSSDAECFAHPRRVQEAYSKRFWATLRVVVIESRRLRALTQGRRTIAGRPRQKAVVGLLSATADSSMESNFRVGLAFKVGVLGAGLGGCAGGLCSGIYGALGGRGMR